MRDVPGRRLAVNDRVVYIEESGKGHNWVVFEAGAGAGRTSWDPVLPLLAGNARLVAYDRAGRALPGRTTHRLSLDDMAADLVAMTETVVPGRFVLVAHSMGGLVARRAAERLGSRLQGLLLVDPTPETAPVYDDMAQFARKVDRMMAVSQALTRFRPLTRLFTGNIQRLFPGDTYHAMLAEDVNPAGISQTRKEIQAVAAAVPQFRAQPPQLPKCPTIVLSAGRPAKGRERQHAALLEHQRRYAETVPGARHESIDSTHMMQAEQPQLIATRVLQLIQAAT